MSLKFNSGTMKSTRYKSESIKIKMKLITENLKFLDAQSEDFMLKKILSPISFTKSANFRFESPPTK